MNPQWAIVWLTASGLAGNFVWTLVNLRIENKVLNHIDALKDWVDARYQRLPEVPAHRPSSAHGLAAT